MEFKFNNIGIVESTTIQLKGLTVLTGLNDSGKSFLSKSIFSIIKTNKEASIQARIVKGQQLQQFFVQLQNAERFSLTNINPAQRTFNVGELFNRINQVLIQPDILNTVIDELDQYTERIRYNFSVNTFALVQQNGAVQMRTALDATEKIKSLLLSSNNPEKENIDFFDNVIIQQLFKSQINGINLNVAPLEIIGTKNNIEVISLKVLNNKTEYFKGNINEIFSETVLIESPITLQLITFIINGLAFGGTLMPPMNLSQPRIAGLPLHFYDLINKIVNNVNNPISDEYLSLINKIKDIIGGRLYYDPVSRSINYEKDNQGTIKDYNIASGIKALGLLGLLLAENIISKKTLLIIDEPEVHLHPTWEIVYAQVIIELVKSGIPILISSHSPYLIKAISKYSQMSDISDKVKFYLGEKLPSGSSSFKDVTDDLTPIYTTLSGPMREILLS